MAHTQLLDVPLSVAQAARQVGVSEHSIRALIKTGRIAAFKLGPHWRIRSSALAAVIALGSNQPPKAGQAGEAA